MECDISRWRRCEDKKKLKYGYLDFRSTKPGRQVAQTQDDVIIGVLQQPVADSCLEGAVITNIETAETQGQDEKTMMIRKTPLRSMVS